MSTDERILRLENAFATLSELAARSQEVDAQHEARLSSLAESNRNLAEANRLIVELIRRHDERVDEFRATQSEFDESRLAAEAELRALREETDHKFAALVDAQIRGEESMEKVRAEQAHAAQKIAELAEAQARTEAAVERLSRTVETILRNSRGGQSLG